MACLKIQMGDSWLRLNCVTMQELGCGVATPTVENLKLQWEKWGKFMQKKYIGITAECSADKEEGEI